MLSLYLDSGCGYFKCCSDGSIDITVDMLDHGKNRVLRGFVTNTNPDVYYTDVTLLLQSVSCISSPFGITPFGLAPFGGGNCKQTLAVPFKLLSGIEFPTTDEWNSLNFWGNSITLGNIGGAGSPSVNTRLWFYMLVKSTAEWNPGITHAARLICKATENEI